MSVKLYSSLEVSEDRLREFFKIFNRFMVLLFRLGLGSWGNGTKYTGYIMVLKHKGRRTGLRRLSPVNYAEIDGDLYCLAAFGESADWYRNVMADPEVEVWLPKGWWSGTAEDATDSEDRVKIFRKVLIASGFAAPLFGFNPNRLSDEALGKLLNRYRLVRIRRNAPLTGAGGPGDLAWVWPLSTFVLLWLFVRGRGKRK
jgi:deazaflavin-dependent oxidoreductase (nitroreductase family)